MPTFEDHNSHFDFDTEQVKEMLSKINSHLSEKLDQSMTDASKMDNPNNSFSSVEDEINKWIE